jgi:hypothetical protein
MPDPYFTMDPRPYEALLDAGYLTLEMELWDQWHDKNSAELAIVALLQYIGKADNDYWRFVRVWRVQNQLHKQAARAEKAGLAEVAKVCRFGAKSLDREYNKYLGIKWEKQNRHPIRLKRGDKRYVGPFKKWDWDDAKAKLVKLATTKPATFAQLLRHLETNGGTKLRDPLFMRYLRIMRDIKFEETA